MNFEIHATVENSNVEKFKADCVKIGCKPLLIELQNKDYVGNQLMTSQKFKFGNWEEELKNIKEKLTNLNYKILRLKVEKYPENRDKALYLESHVRVKVTKDTEELLDQISESKGFHKSRNVFKKINDTEYYVMSTYRTKNLDLNSFWMKLFFFKEELTRNGFNYDKVETESCIFDSNENLDKSWLN
jgi:hypothetical protein